MKKGKGTFPNWKSGQRWFLHNARHEAYYHQFLYTKAQIEREPRLLSHSPNLSHWLCLENPGKKQIDTISLIRLCYAIAFWNAKLHIPSPKKQIFSFARLAKHFEPFSAMPYILISLRECCLDSAPSIMSDIFSAAYSESMCGRYR